MTDEPKPRRIGRLALAVAALALAGSTAFLTWWTTTLMGLPDVGDPFDVAAFTRPIADDANAFVLYRKAAALLPKEPAGAVYDWNLADQEKRDWVEKGRGALAIWRQGTDRPDSLYINPGLLTFATRLDVAQDLRSLGRLALIEGSRLEDAGDLGGSLDWSLALLRASRHCGRRGTFIERLIGIAMHRWAGTRLIRWAADPRVDARLLRRALDASIAIDAMTSPPSDGLKTEYLSLLRSIGDPEVMNAVYDEWNSPEPKGGSNPLFGLRGWKSRWTAVRRRAISDPERSRRVVRMVFANWLAYADLPPSRQPPKAFIGLNSKATGPAGGLLRDLFLVGDDAPAPARALPPEKLARWFASTVDAEAVLPAYLHVQQAIARERSGQDGLIVTLATELYKRENGHDPGRNEDLVGPYLKALPPSYLPSK